MTTWIRRQRGFKLRSHIVQLNDGADHASSQRALLVRRGIERHLDCGDSWESTEDGEAEGGSGSAVEGSGKMPSPPLRSEKKESAREQAKTSSGTTRKSRDPLFPLLASFFLSSPALSFFAASFLSLEELSLLPFSPISRPAPSSDFPDRRGLVPLDNFSARHGFGSRRGQRPQGAGQQGLCPA